MIVKGQIVSSEMEILAYANIYEVGTNNSTKADEDGRFTINVASKNSDLKISHVGYDYDTVKASFFDSQEYFELFPTTLDEVTLTNNAKPKSSTSNYGFLLLAGGLLAGWLLFSGNNKSKIKKITV